MSLYQKNGRYDRCCRQCVRGGAVPEHALSPLAGGGGGGVSCLLRRQDGGVPSQAATSAAPPVAARPESARWAVSLHGDSVLPTRRIASPYTANRVSLHGGFGFPTRRNGAFCAARHILQYVTYRVIIPWGVIVPHRNRTRVWGGLVCAFYNGRDARWASCGRDARHPDYGRGTRCPCYAAKMAAFPVRPRQARPSPWWRVPPTRRCVIVPHRNRTRVSGVLFSPNIAIQQSGNMIN